MANVTFSSPRMKKDLTVYAVAGDTKTLLAVAQANKAPYGVALTEKEKTVLRFAGKITAQQIADAETKDVPPPWRLACQFIVRNEDILVTF